MNWEQYKRNTVEHQLTIRKLKLYTHYSIEAFKGFPKNLPSEVKTEWASDLKATRDALGKLLNGQSEQLSVEGGDLLEDKILLIIYSLKLGLRDFKGLADINFEEQILSQGIVMAYALLDAFFNNTIRSICNTQPLVLIQSLDEQERKNRGINEKQIGWKEVIQLGDYDSIINSFIEEFSYKFGMKSIKKRIKFLNEKLGLPITISKDMIEALWEGEQLRHSIIHAGGIVDNKLKNSLPNRNLVVGEKIELDILCINNLYKIIDNTILEIFKYTSLKYYKINENEYNIKFSEWSDSNKADGIA